VIAVLIDLGDLQRVRHTGDLLTEEAGAVVAAELLAEMIGEQAAELLGVLRVVCVDVGIGRVAGA